MIASSDAASLSFPRLHLVTEAAIIRGDRFARLAANLMHLYGGRIALHLRGRALSGREFFDAAMACAAVARETGTVLVINDRVDVALCCGAPAIQLPRHSLRISDARRLVGEPVALGASVHSPAEATRAVYDGADFLLAGTVFSTPSHPDLVGTGAGWLAELQAAGRPVIAIGGITAERTEEVLQAGAHGVAVMRAVWASADPVDSVGALLEAIGTGRGNLTAESREENERAD